ncbi:hypothetical protein FRC02_009559 [Tulasnella sp. 418]|nr:hypothetical protein FRC02_009559 [Tulasnella sp. 418]
MRINYWTHQKLNTRCGQSKSAHHSITVESGPSELQSGTGTKVEGSTFCTATTPAHHTRQHGVSGLEIKLQKDLKVTRPQLVFTKHHTKPFSKMMRGVKGLIRGLDRLLAQRLPPSTSAPARLRHPNSLFNIFNLGHGGGASTLRSSAQTISTIAHVPRAATRISSIQSSLTFPTRVTLGRPLYTPFLPKVTPIPRNIAQVGLGTARNFSSTRHVFQNIVDNVPIATRAFWEADWEVKYPVKTPVRKMKSKEKKKSSKKVADKLKPKSTIPSNVSVLGASSQNVTSDCDTATAFSHFFPAPTTPQGEQVTTYLSIPLAPSESPRRPLAEDIHHPLLPVSNLFDTHDQFSTHAIRVASLFRKLDAADVWSQGVECDVLGGTNANVWEQTPRRLVVKFSGWTKDRSMPLVEPEATTWDQIISDSDTGLDDWHHWSDQDESAWSSGAEETI